MNSGVYKITNTINGKFYIGSSGDIETRWTTHINSLNRGNHHSKHLQRSWNKYGSLFFIFSIIEKIEISEQLIIREQHYLDVLLPWNRLIGYNISPTAGSCLGIKRTDETKQKLREINIGKKVSDEVKQRISEGLKSSKKWRDAITSDEYRQKMREVNLGENNPMWGKTGPVGEDHHMWGRFGKDHHRAKKILQYEKAGKLLKEWDSLADAERAGFNHTNVSSCCSGKLKSAYGYVWKFKLDDE